MKPSDLVLLLLAAAAAASLVPGARADVRVEVDPGAPFTEADLADAVEIRGGDDAGGGGDVVIRVAKLGMDQLIVIVGDRSQVVTLTDRDRAATSRVVALVVTAMLGGDEAAARPVAVEEADDPTIDEMAPPLPPPAHRTAFLASGSITRDDNGYWIPFVNVGVARGVAPSVRVVGTLGFGRYDGYLNTSSMLFPLRVGLEGRAGAVAIELGGQMINYREGACHVPQWGHVESAYTAGKIFVPVGSGARFVGEVGGHFALGGSPTMCNSASNYTGYGGWLGAGFEWLR